MTPEIEALLAAADADDAAATPGPWVALRRNHSAMVYASTGADVATCGPDNDIADARFIAAVRTREPLLCAALREATRRAEEAERLSGIDKAYAEDMRSLATAAEAEAARLRAELAARDALLVPVQEAARALLVAAKADRTAPLNRHAEVIVRAALAAVTGERRATCPRCDRPYSLALPKAEERDVCITEDGDGGCTWRWVRRKWQPAYGYHFMAKALLAERARAERAEAIAAAWANLWQADRALVRALGSAGHAEIDAALSAAVASKDALRALGVKP